MIKGICILVGTLCALLSYGQRDSIIMEQIEITDSSLRNFSEKYNNQSWSNNETYDKSLTDLLARESDIYFKNYGPNTLSTSSIRGGNASQTAIYWNGIPINNPMLGLLDLSLLPSLSMERIALQKGGSSALWGSGNVAGAIQLENRFPKEKIIISSRIGSFDNYHFSGQVNVSNKRVKSSTKLEYTNNRNNYPYSLNNGTIKNLENASAVQYQWMQNLYFSPIKNHEIILHAWYTRSIRGIPPTTQQTSSRDSTLDVNQRYNATWKYYITNGLMKMNIAFLLDNNTYLPEFGLVNPNKAKSFISEWTLDKKLGVNQRYLLGVNYSLITGETNFYDGLQKQNRLSIFGSYQIQLKKWIFKLSARQELINSKLAPTTPALDIDFAYLKKHFLHFKFNRNYRFPALNDIYWVPGGNEDLKAEHGWGGELGTNGSWQINNIGINYSSAVYSRIITDWILWSRGPDVFYFSAFNIAEVWSRGLENKWAINYSKGHSNVGLSGLYNYTLSTSQKTISLPRLEKGQQLWYTPEHQGQAKLSYNYKKVLISYDHQFVGKTEGFNVDLPAYTIGNILLKYGFKIKKLNTDVHVGIQNITDSSYRVIERRPMPGRNFEIGIKFYY